MKRIVNHIIVPAMMTVLFFAVALTPVEVLGCFLRGLIAMLIALISGLAALVAVTIGAKGRVRHDKNSIWWVLSTLILVIPVIALIILA
ncbi:MAG: hypothetical protein H6Q41_1935 [Deltaproteobacteria bacterium]|jgi:hypothetical protein|nr:hypothetical protein [Deltaproteobacteria bacterium]